MQHTLIIRHVGDTDNGACFRVERLADGKQGDTAAIVEPATVASRPNSNLSRDLRWYLERFLDYPFPPDTEVAEQIQTALENWGAQAFQALFTGNALLWFYDAYRAGLTHLTLKIASDNPRILAWPWEALHDPQSGTLAHFCRIERRLDALYDPLPLPDNLPRDSINILLITARPKEADVGFRALSRPLLELIQREKLPATLDFLRPPTFANLREQLRAKPGHYHIVHFDGHGGYGAVPSELGQHQFRQGAHGLLCFENDEGKEQLVDAEQLSTLLREHRIPIMVLNACQSAMIDEQAEDAFASVAGALQKAGINAVVAMAYSLYVSGAVVFIPAFYRRLFEAGDVGEAVRAGRQAMREQTGRICARGEFPLQDWLVPVVYQQNPPELAFAGTGVAPERGDQSRLPPEIAEDDNPYGFIGRDTALLALERAWRRKPAGILVHGLGGVGKTTLAKGFVRWLADTNGLGNGCFWFAFNDIRSSEYVFNRLVERLFGVDALVASKEQKFSALVQAFKDNAFVIVWDNFESVSGIPDAGVEPLMPAADRLELRDFLYKLRGGKTKILITSRSQETAWLTRPNCYRLPLGGLRGEERWEYCNAIVRDLGLSVDRKDADLSELMTLLNGHPLMMRVMLVQLADHSAGQLLAQLNSRLQQSDQDDELLAKLFATLGFVEDSLPDELKPLLVPLALHSRFVDANFLEAMAEAAEAAQGRAEIDRFLNSLETAGLLHNHGQGIYAMHPALSGYLRSLQSSGGDAGDEAWRRAFVDIMGRLANKLAPKQLHEQRTLFSLHDANFYTALAEAQKLNMDWQVSALTQALAVYAQRQRNFVCAQRYFERLAEHSRQRSSHKIEAGAYHQLGMVAEQQRDFDTAHQWCLKALAIFYKLGNEQELASTYHQLGFIAQEQRDFDKAREWYLKSLEIDKKFSNERGTASTYHQLGKIALERRDFDSAQDWYLKSLEIKEKHSDDYGAASTYHQLGRIAEEQRDFGSARKWYQESLAISRKHGDDHGAAMTYHQLGMTAQEQRDFGTARERYLKSLEISEKLSDDYGVAATYNQLGIIAKEQRDFESAGQWYIRSIVIFGRANDPHNLQIASGNFQRCYQTAPPATQAELKAQWQAAGLGEFPFAAEPPENAAQ